MAKRGRKRMDGPRFPGGQVKPQGETPVGELSRARRAYLAGLRTNELFEDELGYLHLSGVLTEVQRLAGREFGKLVMTYRRIVLDGVRSHAKLSNPEGSKGGTPNGRDYDQDMIDALTEDYNSACQAVSNAKTLDCLIRLCVDGEILAWWEKEEIKPALNALVPLLLGNKTETNS